MTNLPAAAGIYKIVNGATGSCYVGATKNLRKRWSIHQHELKRQKHGNSRLQNEWNEHGAEAFCIVILELVVTTLTLEQRENWWMNELSPNLNFFTPSTPRVGYKRSALTRRRMADAKHKHPALYAALLASNVGRKQSPETIAKIRAAKLGKPMSAEARLKMSRSKMGKRLSAQHVRSISRGVAANWAARN